MVIRIIILIETLLIWQWYLKYFQYPSDVIVNIYMRYILLIIGFLALRCLTLTPQALDAQKTAKFNCDCHRVNL